MIEFRRDTASTTLRRSIPTGRHTIGGAGCGPWCATSAALLLVAVLIVGGVALRIVQVGQTDERTSADAIVVLGAAQYDGEPSPVFQARLDHAAELYRDGVAPRILTIGGGQTGDRTTEGAAGAAYLAELGIEPSALTAVGTGDDTLASLRAAEALLAENGWHVGGAGHRSLARCPVPDDGARIWA